MYDENYVITGSTIARGIHKIMDNSQKNKEHKKEKKNDMVDHPNHYNMGKFEVIDVIMDWLSPEAFEGFCVGNAIKYIARYKFKNGIEDLRKAVWYLNRLIILYEIKELKDKESKKA